MERYIMLEKNITQFLHNQVGEIYHSLLTTNERLIKVQEKKRILGERFLQEWDSYQLEETINEYITILTEEVYKQAFLDFLHLTSKTYREMHNH